MSHVSDIKLIRTDTTLDLSQKAEKAHWQVSIEEGEAKARELNIMFIDTSAKAGFNIKALFQKIAALPGMETLSSAKQEDMVDVNLKSPSLKQVDALVDTMVPQSLAIYKPNLTPDL
ncbi:unnamed protein product, partial [Vitis vinifera]|uniref:Uncharacterized protein n=1 Tax=Vitis vinifera TaxID=29760 RepID=D7TU13_VITVI